MRILSLLCVSLLLSAPRARAAESPTGSLAGVVRTSDGLPLPGVAVVLAGQGGERRVTTGPDGSYRATALAPATPTRCTSTRPALRLRDAAGVAVGASETRLDLVLVPEPVRERVVVSATRGEATLSSLGVSADVLDRERIDERGPRPRCCRCSRSCPASPRRARARPASRARCSCAAASRASRA